VRVTVVIVTFQSADTLQRCLESIPAGVETVVVDNASSDGSPEIATAAGASLIRNGSNVGFAAAANQGARHGSAPFLLFLNPDAELEDGCLDRLAEAFDARPNVAVVGPDTIHSATSDPGMWPFPRARRTWAAELGLHRVIGRRDAPEGFVVGTCMLVRRSWFERLDGFDEQFFLYGEDADFCQRALALGGRSETVRDAAIKHVGAHSANQLASSFEHFHRGTELFILRNSGRWALLSHRVAVLTGALIRTVAFLPASRERSRWFRRLATREATLLLRSPTRVP
jgi:GT2 family glycosyltransferase